MYPSILYGFVGVSERCEPFCRSGERDDVLRKANRGSTVSDNDSKEKMSASAEFFREGNRGNLTYDGIGYSDQLDQLYRSKYITKEKSGVSRPLVPVFNEVLYLGETRWNSKHRLQEMMNIPESMMDFKNLLPEYRVHIVDIHEQDPEVFHTEWKDIFRLMKHSRKKEELKHYVEAHIEEIRKLSMDTRIFLSILLDQYSILEDGKVEVKEMCQAWDGAMMMYYEEGMSEGISQGIKQGISQGIKQGISQGIKQGISQGISQGIQTNRQETIRRMLSKKKYTYEEIGELNGVAVETVKKIENQFC